MDENTEDQSGESFAPVQHTRDEGLLQGSPTLTPSPTPQLQQTLKGLS